MKSHQDNPAGNALPQGIPEDELLRAIAESGYPLQGVVASRLAPEFHVLEEWGYVDDSTKEHRSLDIHAYRRLVSHPTIHPSARLLIECKRSRHPFLFFQQVVPRGAQNFPYISGLPNREVHIGEPSGKRVKSVTPAAALGLNAHSFVSDGPPICASFSKAVPSGKKVELSGVDPFNTIILPLVKAFRHTLIQGSRPEISSPLYPTLEFCMVVIDAPMLVVESPDRPRDPILRPWVRIVRHESHQEAARFWQSKYYTIDVVHIDFLDEFLRTHLCPFLNTFSERAHQLEAVFRYGGQVPNLDDWRWDQIVKASK